MTESPLIVERDGHIVTWTLNAPETRNAISDEDMIAALEAAVAEAAEDHTIRVAILTGSGTSFSSGGNIKHMRDRSGMFGGSPAQLRHGYRHGIQRIPQALYHCEVPVIAAVNGPAIGAGLDLSLMCDLRIASTEARMAESFVKVGIVPGDGGAWLLPGIIGNARAAEMAFTGDAISAQTALEWGIVSEVYSPDELMPAARKLADRIAVNPPQAVRMTKHLLRQSRHQSLDQALESAAAMQSIAHHTADHKEAVNAMLEKRAPQFTAE